MVAVVLEVIVVSEDARFSKRSIATIAEKHHLDKNLFPTLIVWKQVILLSSFTQGSALGFYLFKIIIIIMKDNSSV